jgi:hypothetical protein
MGELTLGEYQYCLRDTPEKRYQSEKEHRYFHDCTSYDGVTGGYREFGCTS